jgi:hypothetical protein
LSNKIGTASEQVSTPKDEPESNTITGLGFRGQITLGEYRPDKSLLGKIKPRFPDTDLRDLHASLVADAGKLHFPDPIRVTMLRHIKDEVRRYDKHLPIALCKDSPEMWRGVGLKPAPLVCDSS